MEARPGSVFTVVQLTEGAESRSTAERWRRAGGREGGREGGGAALCSTPEEEEDLPLFFCAELKMRCEEAISCLSSVLSSAFLHV